MQSTLYPEQENISLLQLCRLLCPAETKAFEAAIVALRQPAKLISWKAETPRSASDYSGDGRKHSSLPRYADDDDYDNCDVPSATDRQVERTEQAIAASCLKTIVATTTKAAVTYAISRKGSLLPPSFFAQPEGRIMLENEIRAQLYGWSRSSGPWANSAFVVHRPQERKAPPLVVGKNRVVSAAAPVIDPAAQEHTGDESRTATVEGGMPENVAQSRTRLTKLQRAFWGWFDAEPLGKEGRTQKDLARGFKKATGLSITPRTIGRLKARLGAD
jgi:hypothetical protein